MPGSFTVIATVIHSFHNTVPSRMVRTSRITQGLSIVFLFHFQPSLAHSVMKKNCHRLFLVQTILLPIVYSFQISMRASFYNLIYYLHAIRYLDCKTKSDLQQNINDFRSYNIHYTRGLVWLVHFNVVLTNMTV